MNVCYYYTYSLGKLCRKLEVCMKKAISILLSAAIERVVLFLLPDPKGGDLDA